MRAADYGQRGSLAEYVRKANEETLIVVHVETASAVDEVEAIAAVDGIDVVFLGPADLSQSLGVPGEVRHPTVLEHLERAASATLAAGKALGVTVPEAEAASRLDRARGNLCDDAARGRAGRGNPRLPGARPAA